MAVILVRHAAVQADPLQHAALWPLSDAGRQAARELAREPLWRDIGRMFVSPELKAHETAQIIAGPNGITVTVVEDLREVERPVGQWFGAEHPGGYPGAVGEYFARPAESTHGWEPPMAALARVRACIDTLREIEPQPFAIAGHGLTLALYVAALTGVDPGHIWPTIRLPDLAVAAPEHAAVLYPFGRWARAGNDGGHRGVFALARTAWGGDHP